MRLIKRIVVLLILNRYVKFYNTNSLLFETIMWKKFEMLANEIHKITKGELAIYVPNGGNWGDAFIREATLKFLNDNSISYIEIPFNNMFWLQLENDLLKKFFEDKVLIYGGGGAWCSNYYSGAYLVNRIHPFFKKVIVLPSTLQVQIKTKNVIYFCRDRYESKKNYPKSTFCHDMALYMTGKIKNTIINKKNGYFFRLDKESTLKIKIPDNNIDISSFGNEMTPIIPFIAKINEHEIINTDRLHVAIAACVMDKKLNFYEGAYYKNEAVFKSSIVNYFKNVSFFHLK